MEHRRTRRFKLRLPLSVTRTGSERTAAAGYTRDISSNGVLFTTEREPDLACPIEYVITLNRDGPRSVCLRCIGKVIRAEPLDANVDPAPGFKVAATLERYEFIREQ
jgi:hypothetical protein